jgi:hypothetical protein
MNLFQASDGLGRARGNGQAPGDGTNFISITRHIPVQRGLRVQPKNEDIRHLDAHEVKCRIRSFWLATKMSGNCQILQSDIELPATFWRVESVRCDPIYRSASPTVTSHRNDVDGQLHIHRTIRKLRQRAHKMRRTHKMQYISRAAPYGGLVGAVGGSLWGDVAAGSI